MTYKKLNFDEMTIFNRQVRKSKARYPSDSHHAKVLYMDKVILKLLLSCIMMVFSMRNFLAYQNVILLR
ncbi:MAG: hypothetical protein COT43_05425 [Candidatus Marinimicrobia bacterium CG08_land_8_20_14_0_20_45_22]|nr:MAG: hypothetical protein COT43_05425 [Candidatus Marinimicrobia bacterium CG08_land_8_20_14_0_20_45_22]